MIKLYGPARTRAARCLWMLEEIGQPYEHLDLDGLTDDERMAHLTPVNPIGKIPALEDGDARLFESMAINIYLAQKYGGALWPDNPADQGRAIAWSIWGMTEMEPPLAQLFYERALIPADKLNAENEAKNLKLLERPLRALETELDGKAYLIHDNFSAADLNLASVLTLMERARFDLGGQPNIRRWLDACYDRPSYRASRSS